MPVCVCVCVCVCQREREREYQCGAWSFMGKTPTPSSPRSYACPQLHNGARNISPYICHHAVTQYLNKSSPPSSSDDNSILCLITRISQDLLARWRTALLKPTARGTHATALLFLRRPPSPMCDWRHSSTHS